MSYDEKFFDHVDRDEGKAWNLIQILMLHTQASFCLSSLGSKIHLDIGNSAHRIEGLKPFHGGDEFKEDKEILNVLTKGWIEEGYNLAAFFTLGMN